VDGPEEGETVCAPAFMVLGFMPSMMNRFMLSNSHEVLFVNGSRRK
jgi:hypothetical protein